MCLSHHFETETTSKGLIFLDYFLEGGSCVYYYMSSSDSANGISFAKLLFPVNLKNYTFILTTPEKYRMLLSWPRLLSKMLVPVNTWSLLVVVMTGALVQIVLVLELSLRAQKGTKDPYKGLSNI